MKLKRLAADFQVDELSDFAPAGGPFALYRLAKESLTTFDAIEAVERRWNIARDRIGFGGLKDKYAATRQFVTIHNGPRRDLSQEHFRLTYLGQVARPFTPKDIAANRFAVTLRDLSPAAVTRMLAGLDEMRRDGLPNYFDDQRFGSVGASREFVGQAWCLGNYERAIWLALAEEHDQDRADEREEKRLLREGWGRWSVVQKQLGPSLRRDVVAFLAHRPQDFRGAITRIPTDLRGLYLAAFQSFLWNAMVVVGLRRKLTPNQLLSVQHRLGDVAFPRGLDEAQRTTLHGWQLPLPSARTRNDPDLDVDLLQELLQPIGLTPRLLRVPYPRDSFFSKGTRPVMVAPGGLTHDVQPDELYEGQQKLVLQFDLPRGAYATILVKRLDAA